MVEVHQGVVGCGDIASSSAFLLLRDRGECEAMEKDARDWEAVEPESYWPSYWVAAALMARGQPIQSVEVALRQAWDALPKDERAASEAEDRANLALAQGDFAGAERATTEWDAARTRQEVLLHSGPQQQLANIAFETGDVAKAGRIADAFLKILPAMTPPPTNNDPTIWTQEYLLRTGSLTKAELETKRQAWLKEREGGRTQQENMRLGPFRWVQLYAGFAETQDEAKEALSKLPRFPAAASRVAAHARVRRGDRQDVRARGRPGGRRQGLATSSGRHQGVHRARPPHPANALVLLHRPRPRAQGGPRRGEEGLSGHRRPLGQRQAQEPNGGGSQEAPQGARVVGPAAGVSRFRRGARRLSRRGLARRRQASGRSVAGVRSGGARRSPVAPPKPRALPRHPPAARRRDLGPRALHDRPGCQSVHRGAVRAAPREEDVPRLRQRLAAPRCQANAPARPRRQASGDAREAARDARRPLAPRARPRDRSNPPSPCPAREGRRAHRGRHAVRRSPSAPLDAPRGWPAADDSERTQALAVGSRANGHA